MMPPSQREGNLANAKHLMILVEWFGPYSSIAEACSAAKRSFDGGLYLAIGRKPYQRAVKRPQYVGIGNPLHTRMTPSHHKLSLLHPKGLELWMGEVQTAEPSGHKSKVTAATLDHAEWLHARFMRLPLNEMKTKGRPQRSVSVLNRWYNTEFDGEKPQKRPHPDWPDFIDFLDDELPARAQWFNERKNRVCRPPDFERG